MEEIIAKSPILWFAKYENINEINVNNKIIPLYDYVIYQYNHLGEIVCKYNELPMENMILFGLINSVLNELYAIDIKTGDFIISNLKENIATKIGCAIPRVYHNIDNIMQSHMPLSGKQVDSIVYRVSCTSGSNLQYMEFMIGYLLKFNNLNILSAITINTRDFKPRLGIKYLDNEKDIMDPSNF